MDETSYRNNVQAFKLFVRYGKLKLPTIKNIINGNVNAFKNLNKSTLKASIMTIEGPIDSVLFNNPIILKQFNTIITDIVI
jgi:hypothetical protein